MIEIIITLYELILKKDDKFILSKSHASFPLCILLRGRGFKPKLTTHLEIDEKNGITTVQLGVWDMDFNCNRYGICEKKILY